MSDVAPSPAPRSRRSRWLWAFLIASLAVNLFVVGVVARAVWPSRYAAAANAGGGGLFGNLMAYARELPDDRRAALRQAVSKERPNLVLKPLREEARVARREAARLFRAEPFSRDAFLEAEARVQTAETKVRQTVARFAADIAGRMTADERAGFLKWRDLRRPGGAAAQAERDGENAPK
jgi:uncharacterized membrane protein